jgi:hypothetical protein
VTKFADATCPEPAELGAYIDGTLSRPRVDDVTRHVTRCASCRAAIQNIVATEDELPADIPAPARPRHLVVWAVAAAVGLVIVLAPLFRGARRPAGQDAISRLVAATPRSARVVEPRLSGGFPWGPYRGARRADTNEKSPEQLAVSGAAGAVLRDIGHDRDPQSLHAAGVAYLLSGDADTAVKLLADASRRAPGNARVWSDLSAALYASADGDDARVFRSAADAADQAIRLNPRLEEAYFNRALALEHAGTRPQVDAAWRDYLARFPNGPWAAEARERLERRAGT